MNELLIKFIDATFNEFSKLENSEVAVFTKGDNKVYHIGKCIYEIEDEIFDGFKVGERFDYKGICVYKVEDELWVENMGL